ncbi:MAG TPA: IscS subfamily cysteine desulfurase [Vicinamibacterales bacterium]|nr:IscS subfamily cysteine desulfurase [Vicinamibacterales bacterium]
MNLPVYLDSHATTPVDPRVLDAMLPYFTERFGNPSSRSHAFGWAADEAVERAREQVAALIGANLREVVFTSGATESNNLAIRGVAAPKASGHVITAVTEHKAVLDPCRRLEREGFRVTYLRVGRDGLVDPDEVRAAIAADTILISIMAANNEIGVLQPIETIGRLARERGLLFHTDAVQAIGKVPFDVKALGVDLASISAHKLYGPKGVGALYVRRRHPRVEPVPLADGGGQERGLRPGTLNVPGIVGLGAAAELCRLEMRAETDRLRGLRDRLLGGLDARVPGLRVNGSMSERLPHNLNVAFPGVEGEALVMGLKDVAVSSGSACTSASIEPSHVLKGLGLSDDMARASIRFGLSRFTTEEEIDFAVDAVSRLVVRLREMSPLRG